MRGTTKVFQVLKMFSDQYRYATYVAHYEDVDKKMAWENNK